MKTQFIPHLVLALFVLTGCAALKVDSSEWEGMALIADTFGGPTVVEIDGMPPKRISHEIHTLIPYAYVEPGKHVFRIENDKNGILTEGDVEIVEMEATLEEAIYEIIDENGVLSFQKKQKKDSANQAAHTTPVRAPR